MQSSQIRRCANLLLFALPGVAGLAPAAGREQPAAPDPSAPRINITPDSRQ